MQGAHGIVGGVLALAGVLLAVLLPAGTAAVPQASDVTVGPGRAAVVAAEGAPSLYSFDAASVRSAPEASGAFPGTAVVPVEQAAPEVAVGDPGTPGPGSIEVVPAGVLGSVVGTTPVSPAGGAPALDVPVEDPVVTSLFGYRVNPLGGDQLEYHEGIDYGSPCGAEVLAAAAGRVTEAGWHPYGGGQRIMVDHGGGLRTTYNHLGSLGVPVGVSVQPETVLGAVGSTGSSTACHLHFEVLVDGQKVDPLPWLVTAG